jgi:hypothetical protein
MGLPLVTRAEYKAYAGLTSPTSDGAIDILIPKVSELVKSVCRRTFVDYVNDSKIDYFDGGFYSLIPTESPTIAVSALEQSIDYGVTYTALTEFTDYVTSKTTGEVFTVSKTAPFSTGINMYKLTYTAGYETLPDELKLAVFDLISYYLKNDMAVHSPKAPGTNTVQIEYVTKASLPSHIRRVLDLYTANYA